jgi:hypothetical protein
LLRAAGPLDQMVDSTFVGSIQKFLDIGWGMSTFESIQGGYPPIDWIDPIDKAEKEADMHPVSYLFEEIYRDYWGIPKAERARERKRPEGPAWHRRHPQHRGDQQ